MEWVTSRHPFIFGKKLLENEKKIDQRNLSKEKKKLKKKNHHMSLVTLRSIVELCGKP
jgi:hypothetical protein